MRRGVSLFARLRRAVLPVVAIAIVLSLWRAAAAYASSCGFLPMSELVGFAPLQVRFIANQFLPPGSVVWLVDGKPVTWDLANGRSTEIPTYPNGCFGSCNTIPRVTYTFQNPGYRTVVMECKSAGSTYLSSAQGVLVLPPMPETVLLIVAGAVTLSVIKALSVSSRRRMATAARPAATPVSQPTAAVEGSTTHRLRDHRPPNRFRLRRPQAYSTSAADPPAPDSPPSPIQLDPGQGFPIMTGSPGIGPRPPGPVENLRLNRGNGTVTLAWDKPQFDASQDALRQFQIFQLKYTGHNTVPEEVLQAAVSPNTLGWIGPDVQSSIHSRQDVVGYVVKPVYQSLTGQTQGLQYAGPGSTASIAA